MSVDAAALLRNESIAASQLSHKLRSRRATRDGPRDSDGRAIGKQPRFLGTVVDRQYVTPVHTGFAGGGAAAGHIGAAILLRSAHSRRSRRLMQLRPLQRGRPPACCQWDGGLGTKS